MINENKRTEFTPLNSNSHIGNNITPDYFQRKHELP